MSLLKLAERPQHANLDLAEYLVDPTMRPSPHHMAYLIGEGLSRGDILAEAKALGLHRPRMPLTLKEVKNAIPYVHKVADHLAEEDSERSVIFLARDAELLYDAYAVLHPDRQSRLMPGSMGLWGSTGILKGARLARSFLDSYGLGQDTAEGTGPKTLLVDTGFRGSVGVYIWDNLVRIYPNARSKEELQELLPIRLVAAVGDRQYRYGEQILDFNNDALLKTNDLFPRVTAAEGRYRSKSRAYGDDPFAYRLAVCLQLMPHYHAAFTRLVEIEGVGVALPANRAITRNVDLTNPSDLDLGANASVVNPVAAMVVQHTVIKASLAEARKRAA